MSIKSRIREGHKNRNNDRDEFYSLIEDIINNEAVKKMNRYNHHYTTSCMRHSLHVAYYNFRLCKKYNLDVRAGTRAGLLHDMFLYDWRYYVPRDGEKLHGFEHPKKSLFNASRYFNLTIKEQDIIVTHMWPLTRRMPHYKESYIIVLTDKFCGFCEILDYYADVFKSLKKDAKDFVKRIQDLF